MKLVLHIGTEKTGTTMLQKWLYLNRCVLSEQGVFLSEKLGVPNNRTLPAAFQNRFDMWHKKNGIESFEERDRFFDGLLEGLSKEISDASKNHEIFLITSEHFHSRLTTLEEIGRLKSFLNKYFDDIFVVCYFRNQADMAVSLYSTALKSASTQSLENFIESNVGADNYYYNFKAVADSWSSVFGEDKCFYRIYNKRKFFKSDLRVDFLNVLPIDLDFSKFDLSLSKGNKSLSALEAASYQVINEYIPYWDDRAGRVDPLNTKLKRSISSLEELKRGRLGYQGKDQLFDMFKEDNNKFLSKYFEADQKFPSPSSDENPEKDVVFSFSEVKDVVLAVMTAVFSSLDYKESALRDSDADVLRDISLKIDGNCDLDLSDAYSLMALASRARPEGSFIAKKLHEYQGRLMSERDNFNDS